MSADPTGIIRAMGETGESQLADNLARVQERIAAAARRVGRNPAEVTLIAVTKTVPWERAQAVLALGVRHLGENRVQEAEAKYAGGLPPDVTLHLIGHLQTNKARAAARLFQLIHSLDRARLAELLEQEARGLPRPLPALLQVNVAGEASKFGLAAAEVPAAVDSFAYLPHLDLQGLMTIAPLAQNPEDVRWVFRGLRELRDQLRQRHPSLALPHLSMGMTDDYPIAIEEGATLVRVGRAIFGARGEGPPRS